MSREEELWQEILDISKEREVIPKEEISLLLEKFTYEEWKKLFDLKVLGYENGFLIVDLEAEKHIWLLMFHNVSRETTTAL